MTNVQTKPEKKNRFWEIVGKVSLLIVVILGSIQLIEIIKSSSGIKSTAYINEYKYHSAPFVYSYIDTLIEKTYSTSFKSKLEENLKSGIATSDIIDLLRYPEPIIVNQFRETRHFIEMTLVNEDKIELSNLVFNFPSEGYYKLMTNGILTSEGFYNNQITLGNLRAKQKLTLHLWNEYDLLSSKKDTSLSTETNSIKIKNFYLVHGIYAWLFNHPDTKFWFPWFIIMIVFLLVSGYYIFIKSSK